MKRSLKLLATALMCGFVCVSFTSCGKETVDVLAETDVLVNGYDGHGVATVSKGNWITDVETKYGQGMGFMELATFEEALYKAVTYDISPTNNLSNGDEVVLTVNVDNSALESYDFKLAGGSKTYPVSGLDEVQAFDPFENVAVNFSGMSPNGSASVNTSDANKDISLNYVLDKNTGLKNGDEVTVSISSTSGTDVEEYCMSKGKAPTATEKKFTVEGLASYVQALDEIPDDMLDKMINQAKDSINSSASSWAEGNSLKDIELLGYYFLAPKEGFTPSTNNELYCIFKINAEVSGYTEEESKKDKDKLEKKPCPETYYTYCNYNNITILPDGTCSVDLSTGKLSNNSIKSEHGYLSWGSFGRYSFYGYKDLDSMFNACVTSKIDKYTYENTVK